VTTGGVLRGGMTKRQKKQVYIAVVIVFALVFGAGVFAGYLNRNDKLCPDGKAPVAQQLDATIGQTLYLCHDGSTVTQGS
jgi:hypothetical protein